MTVATEALPPIDEEPALDERMAVACGHLNACHAELVSLIGEVVATEAWQGWGIRSIEQWISWRTGLSYPHSRTLVALAGAAKSHPHVYEAFAAGELSVDQAALAIQADPDHDADIAEYARTMTLSQLRTTVRASKVSAAERRAGQAADDQDNNDNGGDEHRESVGGADESADDGEPDPQPDPDPAQPPVSAVLRELLSLVQEEDGSWRLNGRLDADRGAILDAALGEARDRLFREGQRHVTWVDALVDIAQRSLDEAPLERRERFRINLFIDPQQFPTATWTCGIAVPDAIAKLLTCDGLISPVFVENGHPVNVGRSQRIVPERTRRMVLYRDKQCRNPLCAATRGLEVHHIRHWSDGDGPTETWNLVALCRSCHRGHHLGLLNIDGDADEPDGLTFRDQYLRVIDPATHARPPTRPPPHPQRPYRHPIGERLQRWAVYFNPPRPTSTN